MIDGRTDDKLDFHHDLKNYTGFVEGTDENMDLKIMVMIKNGKEY